MITHVLKVYPAYFDAVASGRKTVELRNGDRDYATGDTLVLREWNPLYPVDEVWVEGRYTGRECRAIITEITRGEEWLQLGIVALSIRTEASIDRLAALERIADTAKRWMEDDVEHNGAAHFMELKMAMNKLARMEADAK